MKRFPKPNAKKNSDQSTIGDRHVQSPTITSQKAGTGYCRPCPEIMPIITPDAGFNVKSL